MSTDDDEYNNKIKHDMRNGVGGGGYNFNIRTARNVNLRDPYVEEGRGKIHGHLAPERVSIM